MPTDIETSDEEVQKVAHRGLIEHGFHVRHIFQNLIATLCQMRPD